MCARTNLASKNLSNAKKSIGFNTLFKRAFSRRRFLKSDAGTTAIEFGLLALPFFAIIGAIFETAVVFFASQVLDAAVNDSSRLIKTGQAHVANYTAASYRSAICQSLYGLFDCAQLRIKVSPVANFTGANIGATTDPITGAWTFAESYNHGAGDSIILVEAYYKWPILLSAFDFNLSNIPDNTRMVSAVRVFRKRTILGRAKNNENSISPMAEAFLYRY